VCLALVCVCMYVSHRLAFFLASPSEEEEAGGKNDLIPLSDL
jgi:hypothetical protein